MTTTRERADVIVCRRVRAALPPTRRSREPSPAIPYRLWPLPLAFAFGLCLCPWPLHRTALTDGLGRLALEADLDGAEAPLPPLPPLPYKPRPNQIGPRLRYTTVAEYEAALADYNRAKDERKEAARLHQQAKARQRQQKKRKEHPKPPGVESRARQARRVANPVRRVASVRRGEGLARGACSAPKVLALDAGALEASATFSAGVLGGCRARGVRGCSCPQRHVCTHCGALLFPAEAKQTKARGTFNTEWSGGNFCCAHGAVIREDCGPRR